jgi:hypothetical protein
MFRKAKPIVAAPTILLSYRVSPTIGFIVNTLGSWSTFEQWRTELVALLPRCNDTERPFHERSRAEQITRWLYGDFVPLSCEFVADLRFLEGKELDREWIAERISGLRRLEVSGSDRVSEVFTTGSELFDVLRKGGGQPQGIIYPWYQGGYTVKHAFDVVLKRSPEECASLVAHEAMSSLNAGIATGRNIYGKEVEPIFLDYARAVWTSAVSLVSTMTESEPG